MRWRNRSHFFAIAARLIRQILVDFARERGYQKRGGGACKVSLDEARLIGQGRDEALVALDEALSALAGIDSRKSQAVELRCFGGLSVEETAEALKVSPEMVRRDWRLPDPGCCAGLQWGERMIKPEHWKQIETLSQAALTLEPEKGSAVSVAPRLLHTC